MWFSRRVGCLGKPSNQQKYVIAYSHKSQMSDLHVKSDFVVVNVHQESSQVHRRGDPRFHNAKHLANRSKPHPPWRHHSHTLTTHAHAPQVTALRPRSAPRSLNRKTKTPSIRTILALPTRYTRSTTFCSATNARRSAAKNVSTMRSSPGSARAVSLTCLVAR